MSLERLARERIEQELQALAQEGFLSESGKFYFRIKSMIICGRFIRQVYSLYLFYSDKITDSTSGESDQGDDNSEEITQPQLNAEQPAQPTKLMESKPLESQQSEDEDKTEAKSNQVYYYILHDHDLIWRSFAYCNFFSRWLL